MKRLQTQRADNALQFSKYAKDYLEVAELCKPGEEPKKPGTIEKEKSILARWTDHLGQLRLDQIKRVHVDRFIEKRRKETDEDGRSKFSARTINLDVITFRVVMKQALRRRTDSKTANRRAGATQDK